MSAKPFHLAWFGNFTAPAWNEPFAGNDRSKWANGDFYIDMARSLERAGFDYFMVEDSLMVPDIYGGTAELELKHAFYAPKHDPMALVPLQRSIQLAPALKPRVRLGSIKRWVPHDVRTWP